MKINGAVMSRNRIVAEVRDGRVVSVDEQRVPLRLRSGDIEGWLASRAIDRHRTNSRLLKKALRLTTADDMAVVLSVHACTITDAYWFRPEGSSLRYEDVRFTFNSFDKLALYGDPDSFNHPADPTPELTNIGSFEKCWRMEDNQWWLYKQGTEAERFSEMYAYELAVALGLDTAEYRLAGKYIKSLDFTQGASVNYEPAESWMGANEDYSKNFDALYRFSPECARQYLDILFMDTIVFNMDRHTQNYGLLRDVESGAVLRMAPNFDNNIALIARGYQKDVTRQNDRLIQCLAELLHGNRRASALWNPPTLTRELATRCADRIPLVADKAFVINFVLHGYNICREIINAQEMEHEPRQDPDLSM